MPKVALPKLPAWRWSVADLVASSTVTVAVAGDGLRLMALQGREVNFWQHVSLPRHLLYRGWIAEPEAFGVALRDSLDRSALSGRRLLWALPGTTAMARLLSIRLAGASDPAALIAREAARALPINPEEYYLYWQAAADGFGDHVFVLAVQKQAVDGLMRACAVAKVRPQVIDLKPLALVLAVGQADALIADVEPASIDVLVIVQGLPVMMRSLYLGDPPPDPAAVRIKLVDELSMAIRLYNETNPETPLEQAIPVYLTGELGDAELAGRIAFVTKHPTVQPDVPLSCPPGFPASRFMVNCGLLLKH